ncbi:hypothetical protein KBD45_02270 [Candidatus Dojkabacteria bacterium]|nr:hypothetical protein [Candidatus Dojkabacteria bacterium]
MDNFKYLTQLTLLIQKLIRDDSATPISVGSIDDNTNQQVIGCSIPINDREALIIFSTGNISSIEPSNQNSIEYFLNEFSQVKKQPFIFESIEKAEQMFYQGIAPEIEVVYRNDRSSDSEKLKSLISLAAEKAHENTEFKEKTKAESVNFLLAKFTLDSNLSENMHRGNIGLANSITNNTPTTVSEEVSTNIEEDISISELAKKHPSIIDTVTNTSPVSPANILPPIG